MKKKDFLNAGYYWCMFIVFLCYWEIVLRLQMGDGIKGTNLFFLLLVPAEAAFFATFCGFTEKKINRFLTPIIVFIATFYYLAQLIYYRNFGSLFSMSMTGMGGDAIGEFGWAVADTIKGSVLYIVLLFIPFLITVVSSIFNKPGQKAYKPILHVACLILVAVLWFAGVGGLRLWGNERGSAYYVLKNSLSDTDTTAQKFGALTTSIVEGAAYYFGIESNDLEAVQTVEEDTNLTNSVNIADLLKENSSEESKTEVTGSDTDAEGQDAGATGSETDTQLTEENVENQQTAPFMHVDERLDFAKLAEQTQDEELKSMCSYFASRTGTSSNEYTGLFEGYNLIYICAESFSNYGIDENITPTLYRMANNGIVLNNYYNSFKNTTTNGEFAFLTSLWPDVSRTANMGSAVGSFPQSASKYMPLGLGTLFKKNGYGSYAFHNYKGTYYSRNVSLPNQGYECYFMNDGMKFTTSWPASDIEMIEQSLEYYINEDHFNAYYMTFSAHGAYTDTNCIYNKNIDAVNSIAAGKGLTENALGYYAGEYELDKAMELLLEKLEAAGKLENTVIVIAGDHYPYYLTAASRNSIVGHKTDSFEDVYHSTCIIYNAGLSEKIESDVYCCSVDIAPTILNLFNIDFDSRLLMGTDVFSDGVHKAMLYNSSFFTELVNYDNETGAVTWKEAASQYSEEILNNYLETLISTCRTEYSVSTKIIKNNFYKFVWQNSGLMTEEEAEAETERAKKVDATLSKQ